MRFRFGPRLLYRSTKSGSRMNLERWSDVRWMIWWIVSWLRGWHQETWILKDDRMQDGWADGLWASLNTRTIRADLTREGWSDRWPQQLWVVWLDVGWLFGWIANRLWMVWTLEGFYGFKNAFHFHRQLSHYVAIPLKLRLVNWSTVRFQPQRCFSLVTGFLVTRFLPFTLSIYRPNPPVN